MEVGIGARDKVLLGNFWSYELLVHNSKYFLCGRCNRGWDGDHNKVDFVSTMLSITWGASANILMTTFIKIYFIKEGEWRCLEFGGCEGETWFVLREQGA